LDSKEHKSETIKTVNEGKQNRGQGWLEEREREVEE